MIFIIYGVYKYEILYTDYEYSYLQIVYKILFPILSHKIFPKGTNLRIYMADKLTYTGSLSTNNKPFKKTHNRP
jgi:hypothetical protein